MSQNLTKRKKTMTKRDLISSIAQDKKLRAEDVREVIQGLLDKITEYLTRGDRLELRDFGVFDVVHRKQKIGRNPKKPNISIIIPPRQVVRFTPGKKIKRSLIVI